jgi:amino acid transporter
MENSVTAVSEYALQDTGATVYVGIISIVIVFAMIYLPHFITVRKIKDKNSDFASGFLTPSWIITSVWVGIVCFVLLMDGKFLSSGLAGHIVWAAIILSAITAVGSKLEYITRINISKGNISIEGDKEIRNP